jgi:hypothetical protein
MITALTGPSMINRRSHNMYRSSNSIPAGRDLWLFKGVPAGDGIAATTTLPFVFYCQRATR